MFVPDSKLQEKHMPANKIEPADTTEPTPEPVKLVTLQKSTCKVTVPEAIVESYEKQGFKRVD